LSFLIDLPFIFPKVGRKARLTKHSEAGKRPSPAKNSDTNAQSHKVMWDEISAAAVKKITSLKERLPDMLAQLTYKSNLQL